MCLLLKINLPLIGCTFLFKYSRVNGVNVGTSHNNHYATGTYNTISLSNSLRLAAGDRVSLWNVGALYNDEHLRTHFSGNEFKLIM